MHENHMQLDLRLCSQHLRSGETSKRIKLISTSRALWLDFGGDCVFPRREQPACSRRKLPGCEAVLTMRAGPTRRV